VSVRLTRSSAGLLPAPAGFSPPVQSATPEAAIKPLAFVRDPLRIALFVLTIITVSRVHQHYPMLAKLRPALLLSLAAAGYAWAHPKYLTSANLLKLWPVRRVITLLILASCSAVFGISLGGSAKFILDMYSKTLLYFFLLILSIRDIRDVYNYVWAYVISCGILSYFATFVFKMSKGDSVVTRLSDLYTYDANDLGLVLIVGIAFTLLLMQVGTGKQKVALSAILINMVVAIARSGSRGAFLGFIAVGIGALVLINSIPVARRIMIVVVTVVALLLAAPPGYWEQMKTITKPKGDYNLTTTDGRKAVALRGIGYAMSYPLFGIGIGNFGKAECTLSADKAEANGHLRCGAPHNSYVQAGAETGFPGFIVWTSVIFTSIGVLLRMRRRMPQSWRRGTRLERFLYSSTTFTVLGFIGFAVTSFFLSFAWMDIYYILVAVVVGLLVGVRAYEKELAAAGTAPTSGTPLPVRGRGRGWRMARSAGRHAAFSGSSVTPSPAER
jgi:hypothetical protein